MSLTAVVLALFFGGLPALSAPTLPPGVSVQILLRSSVSEDDTREAVILTAEFAPQSTTGRHTHPGDEYATVLEGTLELHADGQPTRTVTAGEAYHNPRGIVHETRNIGEIPAKLVITFLIEKGAPLTTPEVVDLKSKTPQ